MTSHAWMNPPVTWIFMPFGTAVSLSCARFATALALPTVRLPGTGMVPVTWTARSAKHLQSKPPGGLDLTTWWSAGGGLLSLDLLKDLPLGLLVWWVNVGQRATWVGTRPSTDDCNAPPLSTTWIGWSYDKDCDRLIETKKLSWPYIVSLGYVKCGNTITKELQKLLHARPLSFATWKRLMRGQRWWVYIYIRWLEAMFLVLTHCSFVAVHCQDSPCLWSN